MTELEKCSTYIRNGDVCTITCIKGLWAVIGEYSIELIIEAEHYFNQYKEDGEYADILGGETVLEKLKNRI